VTTRKLTATLTTPGAYSVDGLAFSPDETMLATGGGNDNIYLWKLPAHAS
jgi:WD40 repeat protein